MALYVDGLLNNGRAVTHRSRSMSGPSFPPSSCFFGRSRFSEARLLIENTWEPESSRGGFTAGPSTPSSCSSKFPHSRSTRKRLTFCPFSGGSVCGNSLWETNPVLSVPKGTRERRRIERIPSPGEPSLIFAFSRCLSTSLSCRRCSSFHSNKDGVSSFPFFSYSSSPHRVTLHLSPSRQNPRRYHLSVSCISDSGLLRSQSSDASSPTASCSSLPFLSKRTLTNEGNLCLLSLCLPSFPRGTSMLYDKQERGQWVRSFSSLLNFVSPLKSAVGRQLHLDSHFPLPRLREHRESSALSNTAHTRTNASSLSSHSSLVSFPLHINVPVSALHVASSAGCSLSRSTFASSSISPLRPPSSFGGGLCSSLSAKRLTRGGGIAECRRYYYDSRWVRRLDRLREPKFYQPGPAIQEEEVFDEGKIHPLLKPVSPNWNSRRTGVLAYKVGMMSLWDGWGARHPVTVCQLDRCMVMEQRTLDKDGYEACVMGIGYKPVDKVTKPMLGVYIRARIEPKNRMAEFKCSSDCLLPIGHEMSVRHFTPGQYVFVSGWSKDKGFLGVKKRWGFAGQNASHGVEAKAHSSPGSIGQSKTVNVVWRFKKMAGHAGGDPRVVNCKVFRIEAQRNLIFLKGCIPGYKGSLVKISDARGKSHHKYNRNVPLHFPTFVPQPNLKYPVTIQCPDTEQDPFVYPEIAIPDKEG